MANTWLTAPAGITDAEMTMTLVDANNVGGYSGNDAFLIAGIADLNLDQAGSTFDFATLDEADIQSISGNTNNTITGNIYIAKDEYEGDGTADGVADIGLAGIMNGKIIVDVSIYMGDYTDGDPGPTVTGTGQLIQLSAALSADQQVWVTPFTIKINGALTVTPAP